MADVFSNAYLTIGASAAENSSHGLLCRGRTHRFTKVHVNTEYIVSVRRELNHELSGEHPSFFRESPLTLHKRAWCLQEEIFSPRFIHFTRDEVVFVCTTGTICECRPWWSPRTRLLGSPDRKTRLEKKAWNYVVSRYSSRQISFCQDRLPAISSLTTLYEDDRGKYLAGLWEADMPACLLWSYHKGNRNKPLDPSVSSPPTWSWASMENGEVAYHEEFGHTTYVTDVLHAQINPTTTDPRGLVRGGDLTLRGPMLPVAFCFADEAGISETVFIYVFPEGSEWPDEGCDSRLYLDDFDEAQALYNSDVRGTSLWLLVISAEQVPWRRETTEYKGLVLRPLLELQHAQVQRKKMYQSDLACERVGHFRFESPAERHEQHAKLIKTVTIF